MTLSSFYRLTTHPHADPNVREVFAETDTRLPPLERAQLGARGSVFASPEVIGLYELLFAEAWPVEVNPGRFRSDEARLRVLGRTAGILADLEAAICHELGADRIPLDTGHARATPDSALSGRARAREGKLGGHCP